MQPTTSSTPSSAAGCCAGASSGRWFANRRLLLAGLAVVVLGGAAAAGGWGWLVAAGIAPLLLSVLPCLVMCGLGLCMSRMGNVGGSSERAETAVPVQAREGGTAA